MKKISFEDALILKTVQFFRLLVHFLPLSASLHLGKAIGSAAYYLSKRKKIMRQNLRAAFSQEKTPQELERIAKGSMQSLAMTGIELLRIPEMDRPWVERHVKILGRENFETVFAQGKGVIFLTAHFGSWELLNICSSLMGYPVVALARAQKHPRSDAYLHSLRESKGSQIIYKGMPIREILKALKKGQIVGILSDQDGGKNGTFVKFFNRFSSSPKGVASFAIRTDSPILPAFIFREGLFEHRLELGDPLKFPPESMPEDQKEAFILQQFADILEANIRKAPDQWLWAHRRWKSTPDRSVLILSDGKAGHLNQSMAILEGIQEEREIRGMSPLTLHSKVIEIHFKSSKARTFFKVLYKISGGRPLFESALVKACLTEESYREVIASYADIVVSAGSSMVGVNLFCSRLNVAKSVVAMNPKLPLDLFEAVIVPRHDRLKSSSNVFLTSGALTRMTPKRLEKASEEILQMLGPRAQQKKIGLLMGGDTEDIKFHTDHFKAVVLGVKQAAAKHQALVLATSSRRTPRWADECLRDFLSDKNTCPFLVIANESNRPGAVEGILGASDIVIVSGESMSMISEAVASAKKVLVVMPWDEEKIVKKKYNRFLSRLEGEGRIVRADSKELARIISDSFLSPASPNKNFSLEDRSVLHQVSETVCR